MYGGSRFHVRSSALPGFEGPTHSYQMVGSRACLVSATNVDRPPDDRGEIASGAGFSSDPQNVSAPQAPTPFRKNFYSESDNVRALTPEQVDQLRQNLDITLIRGPKEIKPMLDFTDAAFPLDLEEKLKLAGFLKPTPIQAQAWPILLSGCDFIGIAETGSGKTLAFLLPAVVHILDQPQAKRNEGPIALITVPTRELVEQIRAETSRFASRLHTGVAYGGTSRKSQLKSIRDALDLLVACPGRLIDYMERHEISLDRVTYLVLDEADHMLDMGFEPQIRTIVNNIRADRQTVMFSATWPREVQTLARDLCNADPVHVTIGCVDLKANHNVKQIVYVAENESEKHQQVLDLLTKLCHEHPGQRILIFTETKRGCDILTRTIVEKLQLDAACIHGDKEQRERMFVLEDFRSGRRPVLVATDVASRGLDIKDVRFVINYDTPCQIEDYVHRIGRTGRAGATGTAYTFITREKGRLAKDLIRVMLEANQSIPQDLNDLASNNRKCGSAPSPYRRGPNRTNFRTWNYPHNINMAGSRLGFDQRTSNQIYRSSDSQLPYAHNRYYYVQPGPYGLPPPAAYGGYHSGPHYTP